MSEAPSAVWSVNDQPFLGYSFGRRTFEKNGPQGLQYIVKIVLSPAVLFF